MSNYTRALLRMGRDAQVPSPELKASTEPSESTEATKEERKEGVAQRIRRAPGALEASRDTTPPLGLLVRSGFLDRLRAVPTAEPLDGPCVVFSSVTGGDDVRRVAKGLIGEALQRRLHVTVAEASSEGPLLLREQLSTREELEVKEYTISESKETGDTFTRANAVFREWIEKARRDNDLTIIEGPPLSRSLDAALVARYCDGLVLVARQGLTQRSELVSASDRVQATGCRVVGVVLLGARSWLPGWLDRLIAEWILRPGTASAVR